ncbi:MAG: DUF2723 domain-containing protein [Elusimicrobiota bacterium]|jgi:hypothetical protein
MTASRILSSVLFLMAFAFYLSGLCGTIPAYRDSGDLIASIHTLGIAHPPGYALYILLGKCLSGLIPFSQPAYRANLLSALAGAGAVALGGVVILVFYRRVASDASRWGIALCAVVAALLFGSTPAMVELARVSEMYAVVALFAAGILGGLLAGTPEAYRVSWFLLGLGLAIHPVLIFLLPVFFLLPGTLAVIARSEATKQSVLSDRSPRSPKNWRPRDDGNGLFLLSLLGFLLGASVFLFLPIRSAQSPWMNWGDPSTWRNFWRVLLRADYGGLKLHPEQSILSWTPETLATQILYFVRLFRQEWGISGLLAGVLGGLAALRPCPGRRPLAMLSLAWLLSGPCFFVLSNLPVQEPTTPAILQPYLVIPNLVWAFLVTGGCLVFLRRNRWVAALAVLCLVSESAFTLTRVSHRSDFYTYDYGLDVMRSLPLGAVVFDPDDPTSFTLHALQTTEGRRRDLVLLNFFRTRWGYEQIRRRWPELLPGVPIDNAQDLQRIFWEYSIRQRPFFVELPQKLGGLPYEAQGLVYAVKPSAPAAVRSRGEALLHLYRRRGDFKTVHHPDFYTRHLLGYYAAAYSNLGIANAGAGRLADAVAHYKVALWIDPELAAAYNNWAVVAHGRRDFARAIDLYQKAIELEPANASFRRNLELVPRQSN